MRSSPPKSLLHSFLLGIFLSLLTVSCPRLALAVPKAKMKQHTVTAHKTVIAARRSRKEKVVAKEEGEEDRAGVAASGDGAAKDCKASVLMDFESGDILSEENAHQPLPPASMVKLMTTYVLEKNLQEGHIKAEDLVTASAHVSKIGGSQVYLKEGEQFTVAQLLEALLIQSANDAAVALAEHIAGSSAGFVDLMSEEASRLGMKESEFHSPHGLPPGKEQLPDKISAYDFAILSRALIREFPRVVDTTKKVEAPFRGGEFVMRNHNHLLSSFPGADGLKTGFYAQAGFSVAATAGRNGSRMIAVVMGCKARKFRDEKAGRLLAEGFTSYKSLTLAQKGASIDEAVEVAGGEKTSVFPVFAEEVKTSLKLGDEQRIVKRNQLCTNLPAPVSPNTPCGAVVFLVGNREIAKVPLIVIESIPALSTLGKLKRMAGLI